MIDVHNQTCFPTDWLDIVGWAIDKAKNDKVFENSKDVFVNYVIP